MECIIKVLSLVDFIEMKIICAGILATSEVLYVQQVSVMAADEKDDINSDKIFTCIICGIEEKYDYFGRTPQFCKPIR